MKDLHEFKTPTGGNCTPRPTKLKVSLPQQIINSEMSEDYLNKNQVEEEPNVNCAASSVHSSTHLLNKLRKLPKAGIDIRTPNIAVMGGPSSGKSSLLEPLVANNAFQPRCSGTVTKCPAILPYITSEKRRSKVGGERFMHADELERLIRRKSELAARRNGARQNSN